MRSNLCGKMPDKNCNEVENVIKSILASSLHRLGLFCTIRTHRNVWVTTLLHSAHNQPTVAADSSFHSILTPLRKWSRERCKQKHRVMNNFANACCPLRSQFGSVNGSLVVLDVVLHRLAERGFEFLFLFLNISHSKLKQQRNNNMWKRRDM